MGNHSIKAVARLRFPDFLNYGEWEVKRLGEIAKTFSGGTPSVHNKKYYGGDIPFIRSGEINSDHTELFLTQDGLDNSSAKMVEKGTILYALYGATSGEVGIAQMNGAINQAILAIIPKEGAITAFLYQYLKSQKSSIVNLYIQGGQGNLSGAIINSLNIPLPPLAEQRRIAACLSALDEMLAATNGKLEQLKAYKKGLMQKLFPAKGKKQPELRFKEFEKDGEWEEKKLGEVTKDVNRRNKSNRNFPIYSISNKDGFILQSEQFDGLDSVSRGYDTSLYKIVTSNTFAYNPARINVGSIGYSGNIKECLISSLYVCFKTTEDVDDSFLMYFFDTSSFNQSVENNVEGGIRSYLFYENFSKIKIMFPSISEQKRIVSFLKAIDEIIDALSNKFSELERYKIGMMQKMFPIIK